MDFCLLFIVSVTAVMAVSGNSTTSTNTTLVSTMLPSTMLPSTILLNMGQNSTATNTTVVTLECLNGGRETNKVCICPDDFTGQFCESSNVCAETSVNGFTFPKTVIGQASYSKERCPPGNTNAGFPQATAWCQNKMFTTPQKMNCSLNLNTIDNLLTASPSERQSLASSTQILTSRPGMLTTQNISSAVNIVNSLLTHIDSSQDVSLAAVTTVSQLLDASREQFNNISPASITSLTKTLQNFSLMQSNVGSAFVQPNIAIQSFKMSQSSEIQMTVFSALNNGNQPSGDSSDTLSANRIKLNNTFIHPSAQVSIDVQINVKLKEAAVRYSVDTNIGFVLYNNNEFFRSQVFQPSLDIKRRVITGYLGKENVLDFVNITMKAQSVSSMRLNDYACVLWNYTKLDWSTKGCSKVLGSAIPTCNCKGTPNLANFAMLMSFSSNPEIVAALGLISIIGCALSVVGLTLTVIFQILTRKSRRSNPTILMISICVCMTIVYLVFIIGINNSTPSSTYTSSVQNIIPLTDFHQDPDYGPCTAFTVLLHYFLLAAFTWSTLYAAHIFLMIKNTISGPPHYFRVLSIIVGWGLPAVVVGVSLGITYRISNPLNYRQDALCWLASLDQNNSFDERKPMLWGFLLPVAVMLLFNIAVLFYFSHATCRTNPDLNSSQVTPLRNKMLGCVSMAVVLGLSWVIGYVMLLETDPIMNTILSVAFCLCNTTQGIQIFVLFTLRTSVFKEKALAVLKVIRAPVLTRHRMTFDLRATERIDHEELYRSIDFESCNL